MFCGIAQGCDSIQIASAIHTLLDDGECADVPAAPTVGERRRGCSKVLARPFFKALVQRLTSKRAVLRKGRWDVCSKALHRKGLQLRASTSRTLFAVDMGRADVVELFARAAARFVDEWSVAREEGAGESA